MIGPHSNLIRKTLMDDIRRLHLALSHFRYNKNIHHLAKPCKRYQISLISTASLTRCVLRTMTFHILADMATSEILLKSKMKRNNNLTFIDFPKMGNEVIFQSLLYWCLHLWP